jgi:hypothetical protein
MDVSDLNDQPAQPEKPFKVDALLSSGLGSVPVAGGMFLRPSGPLTASTPVVSLKQGLPAAPTPSTALVQPLPLLHQQHLGGPSAA